VGVAETAQESPRHSDPEGVNQLLPEQALGDCVEDQRSLAGESDQPSFGVDFQKLLQVKFFDSHASSLD
jgi:hypothetical protein